MIASNIYVKVCLLVALEFTKQQSSALGKRGNTSNSKATSYSIRNYNKHPICGIPMTAQRNTTDASLHRVINSWRIYCINMRYHQRMDSDPGLW